MNKILLIISMFLFCLPAFSLDYDYTSTVSIPIRIRSTEEISTDMPIIEGQKIDFVVIKTVYDNEKLIVQKGDIIKGRIDTIITSGMNGFPAEIILDNFEISNIKQSQLVGTFTRVGKNRCFWVYPLKWALTPLFPTGSLTNFIKGGHAKIKTTDVITIYYYPEWK